MYVTTLNFNRELPNPQWNINGYFASKQCVLCWSLRISTSYVHSVHTTFCKSSKSYCYFIPFAKGCLELSRAGVKTCHARNHRQTCGCPAPSSLQLIHSKVQRADLTCNVTSIRLRWFEPWPIRDEYSNFAGAYCWSRDTFFYKITTLNGTS